MDSSTLRRRWLWLLVLAVVVVALQFVRPPAEEPAAQPTAGRVPAVVDWVIDGDTVDVLVDGEERRIRLLNIDAPEEWERGGQAECLAYEATGFLISLIPVGTEIELEYDNEPYDQYGRDLAGIWLGDTLVNAEVARAGLALAVLYDGNDRFYQAVTDAIAEARAAGAGLWDPALDCQGLPMP